MSHSTPPHQGEKGPGGEPGLPSPLGGSEMSCPPTGDGVRGALVRLQMSTTALSLHAPAVSGGRVGSSNAPFLWQKPRRDGELPPPFCTNEESPPCSPSTGSPQRPRAESGLLRTSNSNEEEPLLSCQSSIRGSQIKQKIYTQQKFHHTVSKVSGFKLKNHSSYQASEFSN